MNQPEINLSLISHTNVGKTTLARTLLRRDVGQVFNQAHVTDLAEKFVLIQTGDGAVVNLWDTPGFGDSTRLLKRLRQSENAFLAFLTGVWDRIANRSLWCSQQAILNVRDHADAVLYLANVSEGPDEAAYVRSEMKILEWLGKPIVVLLNQLGSPKDPSSEKRELKRWQDFFTGIDNSSEVIVFDAFARCWVQEEVLWTKIRDLLPRDRHSLMQECLEFSRAGNIKLFRRSTARLAEALSVIVRDREVLPPRKIVEKFLGPVTERLREPQKQAMSRLGERMLTTVTAAVSDLIEMHELSGEAARQIEEVFEDHFDVSRRASKSVLGAAGAAISGALGGLATDALAGGLTFGGGMVAGGIAGLIGAIAAAEGINVFRGEKDESVRWSPRFVTGIIESLVLRYLAVAHFGRGRGEWAETDHPKFWKELVVELTVAEQANVEREVVRIQKNDSEDPKGLESIINVVAAKSLQRLYPKAFPEELLPS